ncbi:MAG: ABC-F family ATP-binding cassette domain-containing protein [Acidobacteriota bacterium]
MNLLSISQVSKKYDLKPVLDGITLAVDSGERVGIIGANGAGKTTLYKLIANELTPDEGTVSLRRGTTLGLLPQQPRFDPDATVQEVLAASLVEVQRLAADYQTITERLAACQDEAELRQLQPEHEQIEHRLEQLGGWQYQHRIDMILGQLGLTSDKKLIKELSGGQRKRVALACALIQNPDLLVLDEPTNQLDAITISWLEQYLDTYAGALLLITHDRYFLDNVVDRMVELAAGKATSYRGGYSDYLVARMERQETAERAHARLLNLLRREEEWLRRGVRARGTKSKYRVQNVLELREQARREAEQRLQSQLSTTRRLGNTVLESVKLSKTYDDRVLIKDLDFILMKGDRVALVGPNGCGKTTLLRLLMGIEEPTAGSVVRGKNTHIAYFSQDRLDMDDDITVWEYLAENAETVKVGEVFRTVRSYLSDFKFNSTHLHSKIAKLSGGEKNRLVLAKLLLADANLLVLDEPTNDLDIETLQWIEQALVDFSGAVLFVTHDRFFLDKVATSLLVFEGGGRVVRQAGNYSLYMQLRSEPAVQQDLQPSPSLPLPAKRSTPRTGLTYKEQQELATLEVKLSEMEEQMAELERRLSDPAAYQLANDHQGISALATQLQGLKAEADILYERWLALEEKRQGD